MGWVESAPYFCARFKTAQDVVVKDIEISSGSLLNHKFEGWAGTNMARDNDVQAQKDLWYVLEVYVAIFISGIIPMYSHPLRKKQKIPTEDKTKDPISTRKLNKGGGPFESQKCLLGLDFNGVNRTLWLKEAKWASLLSINLQSCTNGSGGQQGQNGEFLFMKFELVMAKLQHAFMAFWEGWSLLSPCNWVIKK
jgi:hypothetical protein